MRRLLVKSLLIVFGIAQLAPAICGHDAAPGDPCEHAEPHFHLSILDRALGLEATDRAEHAHVDAGIFIISDAPHDGDAIYLPGGASLLAAKERLASVERAIANILLMDAAEQAQSLVKSPGRVRLSNAADMIDAPRAAIQRWQI